MEAYRSQLNDTEINCKYCKIYDFHYKFCMLNETVQHYHDHRYRQNVRAMSYK